MGGLNAESMAPGYQDEFMDYQQLTEIRIVSLKQSQLTFGYPNLGA